MKKSGKKNAENLCYPGLLVKFQTHDCLRDILLSTGNMTLVEATYDTMWGTGVPLHMRDSVNENKWTSQGLQGKMLTRIRADLKNTQNRNSN